MKKINPKLKNILLAIGPLSRITLIILFFSSSVFSHAVHKNSALDGILSEYYKAIELGDEIKVEAFIEKGVDQNSHNSQGIAPLYLAITHNHIRIIELILESGGDPNQITIDGATPIEYAVERRNLKLVNLLIEGGSNIRVSKKGSKTPLYIAVERGYAEIAELLIEAGAANGSYSVYIKLAKNNGNKKIADLLREAAI